MSVVKTSPTSVTSAKPGGRGSNTPPVMVELVGFGGAFHDAPPSVLR